MVPIEGESSARGLDLEPGRRLGLFLTRDGGGRVAVLDAEGAPIAYRPERDESTA